VVASRGEVAVPPSPGAVLGVQLRGRVRGADGLLDPAGVTGIQQRLRRYGYVGDTVSILVRFTPQGASCLGVPAHELADRSVSLAELVTRPRAERLGERLDRARSEPEAVAAVLELLGELPLVADPLVARAIELLARADDDEATVAGAARAVGISERQLERRFLQRVGVTPKRFAMLCRFERATALAARRSLTEAALEAGYCDPSHFVRDVRRFTGTTPTELLARRA
jgi:AraC-like DNA-binding protein